MERSDIVLAALSADRRASWFNAIAIQVLLFLIDREIAEDLGGPHFDFEPYVAGPFDPDVFDVIESLAEEGSLVIDRGGPYWAVSVSGSGLQNGRAYLERMGRPASRYMTKASRWVLAQSFHALMIAIFRQYPEMAVNSWIPRSALRRAERAEQRRMHPLLSGLASLTSVFHGLRPSAKEQIERDAVAIESDWRAVGDDLRFAMEHARPGGAP